MEHRTISYCHGSTEVPLQFWRSFDRLPVWAERTPNKDMIVFRKPDAPRQSITFGSFHRLTDIIAGRLIDEHPELTASTRVILMGANCLEFCATVASLHKAGLTIVMLHPQRRQDVLRLVDRTDTRAVFYQPEGTYQTAAGWLSDRLPLQFDFLSLMQHARNVADEHQDKETNELLQLRLRKRQAQVSADHPYAIYLTSGTTGEPKLVPQSHHSVVNTVHFRSLGALLTSDDVFFTDRPTAHAVGTLGLVMAMIDGLTLFLTPANTFSGDQGARQATWLLNVLAEERVTSGDFFGYLVHDILQKGGRPPPTLRSALLSGAPTTSLQMELAMAALPGLVNYYGSTETFCISAICPPWGANDDPISRRDTVGPAAPHMEVMVVDPDDPSGAPLPVGVTGEIWVRGFSVMRGYLGDPELSRVALTDTGWFRTGDIGTMDAQGRLAVVNRIKDMIFRAGESVPPARIERVLLEHPDVRAVQALGLPDERHGQAIAACLIMRDGAVSEARLLANWCRDPERLGCRNRSGLDYVPRYWAFLADFPVGPTGKVTRQGVRDFVNANGGFIDVA